MNRRAPILSMIAVALVAVQAAAGDATAKSRLKDLQTPVIKQEFADDKLRRDLLTFCREQVGTPLYARAIEALRPCPAPLDRLDEKAIDEEDRKFLSIGGLVAFERPHNRAIAHIAFSFDGSL